MDKFQPVEGIGSYVASIEINLEQKVQKLSKKAENGFLAITLSPDCEMSSYFVASDNFCIHKQWRDRKNKLILMISYHHMYVFS